MQHLKPINHLIRYIMYVMENDIKIELVKNIILKDGLEVRLYQWYNENPEYIEGHLQLIPEDVKKIVDDRTDKEREYIITNFGGC